MKIYAGWKRLASVSPRNKQHYFREDFPNRPGWFVSACGAFRMNKIQGFDNPPEDRKIV